MQVLLVLKELSQSFALEVLSHTEQPPQGGTYSDPLQTLSVFAPDVIAACRAVAAAPLTDG